MVQIVIAIRFIMDEILRLDKMTNREDFIMSLLLNAGDRIDGRTKLMKLAFLVDRTLEKKSEPSPFTFEAYKYGPFDKKVLDAADDLEERGFLKEKIERTPFGSMYTYELTDEGKEEAKRTQEGLGRWEKKIVNGTLERWGDTPTKTLVSYVYDTYPDYTPN